MAIHMQVRDASRFGEKNLEVRPSHNGPRYFETLHRGLVVDKGESYWGDMEYTYWAAYWAAASGTFERMTYGSDRDPGAAWAEIDAPAPVLARYEAKKKADLEAANARYRAIVVAREREANELREKTPRAGSIVRVVKGRLVPRGLEGQVIWAGDGDFGPRARVAFNDGTARFIDARNLEVLRQTTP